MYIRYPSASIWTPVLVSNLACDSSNPNHLTIYHCPRSSGIFCSHSEDIALVCTSPYSAGKSFVLSQIVKFQFCLLQYFCCQNLTMCVLITCSYFWCQICIKKGKTFQFSHCWTCGYFLRWTLGNNLQ